MDTLCLDRQTMWMLGAYYKAIGQPLLAGYYYNQVNIFPEFEFIEIPEGD